MCLGAAKPYPNYLAGVLPTTEARTPRAGALQQEATEVRSLCTTTRESPLAAMKNLVQPKINK